MRAGADAVKHVQIGKHTITCGNNERKISVRIDASGVAFIVEYIVPLMRQVIHSLALASGNEKAYAPEEPPNEARAPFNFGQTLTPVIRDKVTWDPQSHTWVVKTKGQNKKAKTFLVPVSTDPDPGQYAKAKIDKYWDAVRLWNDRDKSTRARISVNEDGIVSQA